MVYCIYLFRCAGFLSLDAWASSSWGSGTSSLVWVPGLLVEHGLQGVRASVVAAPGSGVWAQ